MSLKPKKKSEIKKIQEKMVQEQRQIEFQNQLPPYTMIVSEGVKTEPLYLNGFAKKINDKYKGLIRETRIVVYGTGRNTNGLLKFIDKQIDAGTWEKYSSFWLVYDKDDFPYDNFDNTQFSAESRTNKRFRVAWSNESIE
ncbi:MAG: RloB family protein [Lachnospiraceae bacterium]